MYWRHRDEGLTQNSTQFYLNNAWRRLDGELCICNPKCFACEVRSLIFWGCLSTIELKIYSFAYRGATLMLCKKKGFALLSLFDVVVSSLQSTSSSSSCYNILQHSSLFCSCYPTIFLSHIFILEEVILLLIGSSKGRSIDGFGLPWRMPIPLVSSLQRELQLGFDPLPSSSNLTLCEATAARSYVVTIFSIKNF